LLAGSEDIYWREAYLCHEAKMDTGGKHTFAINTTTMLLPKIIVNFATGFCRNFTGGIARNLAQNI